MSDRLKAMVLTPQGLDDPSLAIAGSRAGATGVLDVGAAADMSTCAGDVSLLARLGERHIGLRVECSVDADSFTKLVTAVGFNSSVTPFPACGCSDSGREEVS